MPRLESTAAARLARLDAMFDASPIGIAVANLDGYLIETNAAFQRLVGYDERELAGMHFTALTDPNDATLAPSARLRAELMAGARDNYVVEKNYRRKTGETVAARLTAALVREPDGTPVYSIAMTEDITEQRRLEQERHAAEASLRFQAHVLGAVEQAVAATDREGRLTYWNRFAERLFGWPAADVLGRMFNEIGYAQPSDEDVVLFRAALDGGPLAPRERQLRRRDGTQFLATISPSRFVDERGEVAGLVAIIVDITERRQLEEQLRQSHRMEAVGQLAGGIAHDFNNILTVISGRAEFLRDAKPASDEWREDVDEILQAATRASSLTRQLLAFGRKQMMRPQLLWPRDVVENLVPMLRRLIGDDIEVVTRYDPATRPIHADPGQIEQVLVNLVVNARDAMPTGGVLVLATRAETLSASSPHARDHGAAPGDYSVLSVSDSGIGMDAETAKRVFEPFFTTKEPGQGTGLGLATVYGIAKQSGGFVTVVAEPNLGATFEVYLPAASATAEPVVAGSRARRATQGSETILLVEDSDSVRALAERILRQHGYRVLTARNGHEALSLVTTVPEHIDLLVTDVVMPKMSGRELSEVLTVKRPGLRTLFVSGYTDDVVIRKGLDVPGVAFLEKPFTSSALAARVRQVLDDRPSRSAERGPGRGASRS